MYIQLTNFPGRALMAAAAISLFQGTSAVSQSVVLYGQQPDAESCAERLLTSDDASRPLLKACEDAALDRHLGQRDHAAALLNAGIANMRRGNLETARHYFEKAEATGVVLPTLEINIAAAQLHSGDPAGAISTLSDIETIASDVRHIAYYNRATAHWLLGDVEHAYLDFRAADALKPGYAPANDALSHFEISPQ